jgi:hypothetical protein
MNQKKRDFRKEIKAKNTVIDNKFNYFETLNLNSLRFSQSYDSRLFTEEEKKEIFEI